MIYFLEYAIGGGQKCEKLKKKVPLGLLFEENAPCTENMLIPIYDESHDLSFIKDRDGRQIPYVEYERGSVMSNQSDAYRHLFAVPKNEILKFLRSVVDDGQLLNMFEDVIGRPVTVDDLRRATHADLIHIAEASENFNEEDALHLLEEYRYRGTKTLFIHFYLTEGQDNIARSYQPVDLDRFNEDVQRSYNAYSERVASPLYSDLQLRGADQFSIDGENFWEVDYSYIAKVRTTDPDTEEIKYYPDLRYGFIWINQTTPWIAISAKDEKIADLLAQTLSQFLDIVVERLPIPKGAEIAIESYENVRRASHVDEKGVRTRVIHQDLHSFPEEVEKLQRRDQRQMRSSSGYNAEIEETHFVLSYSRERGAISLSKLLRTSQLRRFGVEKLSAIYHTIRDLSLQSPAEAISLVVGRVLPGSKETTKQPIQKLITKLAEARQAQLEEIQVDVNPVELARLKKYLILKTEVQCVECGDLQYIQCMQCGTENFFPEGEQLVCRRCNTPVGPDEIQCTFGHETGIAHPHELITLSPTSSLLAVVEKTLTQPGQIRFNRHEEGFLIRGTTLHIFGTHGEKTVYLIDDIPEFREPAGLVLSDQQTDALNLQLRQYREKCDQSSHQTCAACVQNRVGENCLIRLFGLYDDSYTPRPHYGGEFGDVSLNVTIDRHQDQLLVILLKKGTPTGRLITRRHSIGRDIYSQIVDFWTDPRVASIGVAVAQRMEDGFKARLQREAFTHGKKIIFFGVEELSKIMQFVLDRDGLTLDEL